ncbi:MAG: hypothetical protein NDJ90_14015 [Oligoflexia bacterium]|nr:hypothetical protein [Oligoflexia bacterium]
MIRVRARSSGQTYTIDLRNLFFTDLAAQFRVPGEEPRDPARELATLSRSLALGIRAPNGHEQFIALSKTGVSDVFKFWTEDGRPSFQRVLEIKLPCHAVDL